MKLPPVDYVAPDSLEEALAALAQAGEDAMALAGGQSLVPLLAFRLARPSVLVDLAGIPELQESDGERGIIGAMTRQRRLERDADLGRAVPLLAATVPWIAHPAIRNRGTVGGSLTHADPAAELPTTAVALDATLVLRRVSGERSMPADEFFVSYLMTARAPDELLTEIRFPVARERTGAAFEEVARRHGDFALVGCAASVTLNPSGAIEDARLALCGVDSRPYRARDAEAVLRGATPGADAWDAAAEVVRREIDPGGDLHATAGYRRRIAGHLTATALECAAGRAAA